ncbi:hypothetical protein [Kushneria konosiri]|uniref:Lipoprotein n=1 Tax=Kushneria konosiri TaxID=698828 RepID=A0A2Z2H911_9GAMM|nr:hypothetical protein [Kushneria konosiri]ARS53922.1 hypothetical protein B9G99_14460 [Kushneria konosiri]
MSFIKKGATTLAIAGAMFAVAGCSSSEPKQQDPNIDSVIQQSEQGYRNTTVGYTFTYPENWQNSVVERDTFEWNNQRVDAQNMAVFYYKNFELNSTPEPLLALATYPQQEWEQMQRQARDRVGSTPAHVIGTKNDQVLVAYINTQNPYDAGSSQGQEYARHVLTPGQVQNAISW